MSKARFASFWHGPELSPYEVACLQSFTLYGSEVALYSYEPIANLPPGVSAKDARAILPPDTLNAFPIQGVPSMAHFTDYFRFAMFTKTDEIWVDTDMLLLRDFDLNAKGDLIGKETPSSICTAILRLDPDSPRLYELLKRVKAMQGTEIKWGDTGPRLLTAVYGVKAGLPESLFYPVHFDDYYKPFLPRHFEECAALCSDAYTLHLWNNRVVKMALFKRIGPPAGSFLHHVFEQSGANRRFGEFYPANVMQTMIDNAVQKVGRDEGVRKLLRVGVPMLRTALGRKLGA
ncbi:hypothetical protein GXB81_08655 [Paraburkholderia sp. Ac-20336]|uniref:hypothetical protein n=1 Tax=Burkholderiaceae TaxID=119060 RepID=UPI0014223F95|nr:MULTISPECIES: hypothetical protein [Burkholderiaceae]MBN3803122.1 hypothetical protein [Paraburkholderia sp. Ac-20336]MBN3846904.1 hypothetical protein [Paraburkholderia sp. Ac-20342]NIF53827.1 hypothetical protein [Burkholderia sp. Ax-1724]NIF77637.1 hypothetical protein [Paraburkholderia sp. Cy-641]